MSIVEKMAEAIANRFTALADENRLEIHYRHVVSTDREVAQAALSAIQPELKMVREAHAKVVRIMGFDFKYLIEWGEGYNQCAKDMYDASVTAITTLDKMLEGL